MQSFQFWYEFGINFCCSCYVHYLRKENSRNQKWRKTISQLRQKKKLFLGQRIKTKVWLLKLLNKKKLGHGKLLNLVFVSYRIRVRIASNWQINLVNQKLTVGNVSLEDWDRLTWSFGWTNLSPRLWPRISDALLAIPCHKSKMFVNCAVEVRIF